MMGETSIHGVRKVVVEEIREFPAQPDGRPAFVTRRIVVTTDDGSHFTLTMYGDNFTNVRLQGREFCAEPAGAAALPSGNVLE